MSEKLFTIFCKCGKQSDFGENGMDVNEFCAQGLQIAESFCTKCGSDNTFIRNKSTDGNGCSVSFQQPQEQPE